jgi:hypothetical protein
VRISNHALYRAVTRLGIEPLKAYTTLQELFENSKQLSYEEANKIVPITTHVRKLNKNQKYYATAYNGTNIVFIVKDNDIVTLLTPLSSMLYGIEKYDTENGACIIRTMGEDIYEDDDLKWVRRLREKRGY